MTCVMSLRYGRGGSGESVSDRGGRGLGRLRLSRSGGELGRRGSVQVRELSLRTGLEGLVTFGLKRS